MDIISELITAKIPLSAPDLAARLRCSVGEILEEAHLQWWAVLPISGDWVGWKYIPRPVVSNKVRLPKEVGEYHDDALTKNGPKGFIK